VITLLHIQRLNLSRNLSPNVTTLDDVDSSDSQQRTLYRLYARGRYIRQSWRAAQEKEQYDDNNTSKQPRRKDDALA